MNKEAFPVWREKYDRMGVTPEELYMRQNGKCWLKTEIDGNSEVQLYCTDGKDQALTSRMLNPTFECMQCISNFTCRVVKDAINKNK